MRNATNIGNVKDISPKKNNVSGLRQRNYCELIYKRMMENWSLMQLKWFA